MVERLRSEQTRLTQENDRLAGELEMAQARLAEAEDSGAELTTLREEREVIGAASARCSSSSRR